MANDPNQGQRFTKAARELGADVPEAEFDRALKKLATVKAAPPKKLKRSRKAR